MALPLVVPPTSNYPAYQLVSRAWNLFGIVARDLEIVSGSEGSDGMFLLNELLDMKAADLKLIPYFKRMEFPLLQGQELYYIPNLYQIETFTFNIGVVRFPTSYMTRHHYFGDGRVDNIQALPLSWHLEREEGGSNLYVYFLPQADYIAKLTGKFALTNVIESTNLASVYDGFYIAYLRYALANYMAMEYDIEFAPNKMMQLRKMEMILQNVSPPDYSMRKISFLNNNQSFSWAHINISPGYNP